MKRFDLTGRMAVTGGNGGIGLGMARGLAEAGATIVVAARDAAKSQAALAELTGLGVPAAAVAVDVADEASCQAMVARRSSASGGWTSWSITPASTFASCPRTTPSEEWNKVMTINLTGVFTVAGGLSRQCRAGGGKIINIGSMTSIFGIPFAPA